MLLSATGALAQTPPPDANLVAAPSVPDGRDPKVVADGWKFFYFWRANTSFAQAYADLTECYRFLPVSNAEVGLPAFVPWTSVTGVRIHEPNYLAGSLVSDIIGAMVAGPLDRRMKQSRMRRCMEPRGYQRFPAPEKVWVTIIDNYSHGSIAVQAKLASREKPDAEPVPVTR
ncbi:hypothetical protein [Sphingomonas sp. ERG5]|uniref:hypothetical protein n=1 Tax=Sphingomonas sp. ERG5 TaxID=1381597 RepID=UPI00126A5364|nr:hypothetical protein [Sphingomonas sp. ERG5]